MMKRYTIAFKEVAYGIIKVYADNEEEARALAEGYKGEMYINKSAIESLDIQDIENICDEQ